MDRRSTDGFLTRRDFLRAWVVGSAAAGLGGGLWTAAESFGADVLGTGATDVWVLHGQDKAKLMNAALRVIQDNGGFGTSVKTLALKVNAAWPRTPETGANTHPALVSAFLEGCRGMGVGKVTVPENPCGRPAETFTRSGLQQAVEAAGSEMIDLKAHTEYYRPVDLPKARNLKTAKVASQYIESDAVVNMPVAKHHGSAILTIAMKNWMGAVQDRGFWHRNGLHQCIADFCTWMKPTWTVVDATRTIMDRGPRGPAKTLKTPNLLIVSRDQVAADVFAGTLFHDDPLKQVRYLAIAREMKIGETDLKRMKIHRQDVKA